MLAAMQNQVMNALVFLLSAVFRFNETAYRDHYSVIHFAGW